MEFKELLEIVGDEPVFRTGLLLVGNADANDIYRQLTRWVQAGRLHQLRRGVYTLAAPYCKVKPHPFVLANALVSPSYVSLQLAMSDYDLIPEYTPVVTSVTTKRPDRWETLLGDFLFRHVKTDWFHGYQRREVSEGQHAYLARPEKALLDLIYLTPGADAPSYLAELRLQNLDRLDLDALVKLADDSGRHKLCRAANGIVQLAHKQEEYEHL